MTTIQPPLDFFDEVLRDPLTGLPIPAVQREQLQLALHRAKRNDTTVALVMVDLDGFHTVNERFGLAVGNLVLQTVAGRIQSALRATDVVSRRDDDHFTVVCEEVGTAGDVDRLVHRVRVAVTSPMVIEGHRIELAVTMGSAVSTAGRGAGQLVRDADAAMTAAHRP